MKGFDTIARITADRAHRLRQLGYDFGIRYLVPPSYSKAVTRQEIDHMLAAGLLIGLVWETTANRAVAGAAAGLSDGKMAKALAESMGVPNSVIYFAVDYNAGQNDYDKIASYMLAAECAVRPYKLGVYGSFYVVEELHRRGIGAAYWQCVGWSGGKWSEHSAIQQREGNVGTGVVTVDNNYCSDPEAAGLWGGEGVYLTGYKSIKLYENKKKKPPAQILKETGAAALVNGGLFSLSTWLPVCHLKIDGKVLSWDDYTYWGYGIKDGRATLVQHYEAYPDYIACCCMVRNGEPEVMHYNADMGGARQRTAIGTMPDGSPWGFATLSPTTPERLQSIALGAGVRDAIMLDGGASTWCITPQGELRGGRIAQNYVLFFGCCPYAEPTGNVRWMSIGTGAKWVQWHLNLYGYGLSVDGIFGSKSTAALKDYQQKHGLAADGICGPLTRAKLKEANT